MKVYFLSRINVFICLALSFPASAQMITGVWQGKINRQNVEVKIIQDGDSLKGTSYYYESPTQFRRYSIRGYFNSETNETVWWDDQLLEEKTGKLSLSGPGRNAMLSSADFNCPGGSRMMLDGKAGRRDDRNLRGEVHLDKVANPLFDDEWDYVIDNYLSGTNDPYIIDSIDGLATVPVQQTTETPSVAPVIREPARTITETPIQHPPPKKTETEPPVVTKLPEPVKPLTIEEKFVSRKKTLVTEIPLAGDSIELRFYDNAEIDGDSISLFLNDRLIFSHIRLTGNAYTIKLPVSEMNESNELIMVAENLGSIPPNTSYMVALVGELRYEARLESSEGSSAMVRFVKKKTNSP